MLRLLRPTWRYPRIFDIPFSLLQKENIRFVLADMDNTLVPWHSTEVDGETLAWCEQAAGLGITVILLTNSAGAHSMETARRLGIACYNDARKPGKKKTRELMAQRQMKPEETLIVGDQLFTDIQLANTLGVRSCLLHPVDRKREWWCTKVFNRTREKIVWKWIFPGDR